MMKKWIALYSHTGSEISVLWQFLKRRPDIVISNKCPEDTDIDPDIKFVTTFVSNKPTIEEYHSFLQQDAIITMHGWMRIIPPEICEQYNILNLHPGLFTKYPDLKGKDPQRRAFNRDPKPETVGCVMHRAIEEVDSGEVIMERELQNNFETFEELDRELRISALDMWIELLQDKWLGGDI